MTKTAKANNHAILCCKFFIKCNSQFHGSLSLVFKIRVHTKSYPVQLFKSLPNHVLSLRSRSVDCPLDPLTDFQNIFIHCSCLKPKKMSIFRKVQWSYKTCQSSTNVRSDIIDLFHSLSSFLVGILSPPGSNYCLPGH